MGSPRRAEGGGLHAPRFLICLGVGWLTAFRRRLAAVRRCFLRMLMAGLLTGDRGEESILWTADHSRQPFAGKLHLHQPPLRVVVQLSVHDFQRNRRRPAILL